MRITFDPTTHTYRINDTVVDSVTQILKKAGIVNLQNIPASKLEYARDRGVGVHKAIELLDKGTLGDLPSVYVPYVDAWVKFKNDFKPIIESVEEIVGSEKYMYAGALDRRILLDKRTILDVKTAETFAISNKFQLSAYLEAYNETVFEEDKAEARMVVLLNKDGRYRVQDDKFLGNHNVIFQEFINALNKLREVKND